MKQFSRIAVAAGLVAASTTTFGFDVDLGAAAAQDADPDKDWSGMIGLAAMSRPEYIGSEDSEGAAIPVIIVDYKDTAYFKVNRGGVWFWKPNEEFRVGAVAKIRAGAWEDDDDSIEDQEPLPPGFDEPDTQLEPGVNALYKSGMFSAEVQLTSGEDVNLTVLLDYSLIRNKDHLLNLHFEVESLGEDEVKYGWYGDDSSYGNDDATNVTLGVVGMYTLNPSWKLLYGALAKSLDDEIDDSPIVKEDNYNLAFVGALWVF